MELNYILLYIYTIGAIIAFIIASFDAYIENKNGNDISEAPGIIPVLGLMSWFFVIMYIYNKFIRKT